MGGGGGGGIVKIVKNIITGTEYIPGESIVDYIDNVLVLHSYEKKRVCNNKHLN